MVKYYIDLSLRDIISARSQVFICTIFVQRLVIQGIILSSQICLYYICSMNTYSNFVKDLYIVLWNSSNRTWRQFDLLHLGFFHWQQMCKLCKQWQAFFNYVVSGEKFGDSGTLKSISLGFDLTTFSGPRLKAFRNSSCAQSWTTEELNYVLWIL